MKKKEHDFNLTAFAVVQQAIGEAVPEPAKPALRGVKGRAQRGGLKGGVNRMAALSPEQRSELARMAAAKRWKKPPVETGS